MRRLLISLVSALSLVAATGPGLVAHAAITPIGGLFHALAPVRILDTRDGIGLGAGPGCASGGPRWLSSQQSITVQMLGCGGIPLSGVSAVVLTTTVTNTTRAGYLTVWPSGQAQPTSSNLNWGANQTVANLVEVGVGLDGRVAIYNYTGAADVVFDVAGWVSDLSDAGMGGQYNSLQPRRILDTRFGSPLTQQGTRLLTVAGAGGVPIGAGAVVVNVTVTNATKPGYLTIWPSDTGRPLASSINYLPGQTVAARVMVKLSGSGQISIFEPDGTVDVIVDANGWFTADVPNATGSRYVATTPARILDTRADLGGIGVGPQGNVTLQVAGRGGIPSMSATNAPGAVVANVTLTGPTAAGFLSIWPADRGFPGSSDLNFVGGQTVPNLVVVQLSGSGAVQILNSAGCSHVVVDVVGWYVGAPTQLAAAPTAISLPCPPPPPPPVPAPSSIQIPSIGVNTSIEPVGLDSSNAMAAPVETHDVGWYAGGPAPGAPGHALMDGHVDWTYGPSVFWSLRNVQAGDDVWVGRVDGSTLHMVITGLAVFPANSPPADFYTTSGASQLWLITCTGSFDGTSYADRLIAIAVPA